MLDQRRPPPEASSLVADAYATVRDAILAGELPAGEVTSQVAIGERFGLGRTPLREALRLLQREGLVEAEHFKRLRIAPLAIEDLEELYAERIVTEALAARLSVPLADAADIAELEATVAELERFGRERRYDEWERAHRQLHAALVRHGGARLARHLGELYDHAERYRRFFLQRSPVGWSSGERDHRAIVDAFAARDPERVAAELAQHLARTALTVASIAAPAYEPAKIRTALRMAAGA